MAEYRSFGDGFSSGFNTTWETLSNSELSAAKAKSLEGANKRAEAAEGRAAANHANSMEDRAAEAAANDVALRARTGEPSVTPTQSAPVRPYVAPTSEAPARGAISPVASDEGTPADPAGMPGGSRFPGQMALGGAGIPVQTDAGIPGGEGSGVRPSVPAAAVAAETEAAGGAAPRTAGIQVAGKGGGTGMPSKSSGGSSGVKDAQATGTGVSQDPDVRAVNAIKAEIQKIQASGKKVPPAFTKALDAAEAKVSAGELRRDQLANSAASRGLTYAQTEESKQRTQRNAYILSQEQYDGQLKQATNSWQNAYSITNGLKQRNIDPTMSLNDPSIKGDVDNMMASLEDFHAQTPDGRSAKVSRTKDGVRVIEIDDKSGRQVSDRTFKTVQEAYQLTDLAGNMIKGENFGKYASAVEGERIRESLTEQRAKLATMDANMKVRMAKNLDETYTGMENILKTKPEELLDPQVKAEKQALVDRITLLNPDAVMEKIPFSVTDPATGKTTNGHKMHNRLQSALDGMTPSSTATSSRIDPTTKQPIRVTAEQFVSQMGDQVAKTVKDPSQLAGAMEQQMRSQGFQAVAAKYYSQQWAAQRATKAITPASAMPTAQPAVAPQTAAPADPRAQGMPDTGRIYLPLREAFTPNRASNPRTRGLNPIQ